MTMPVGVFRGESNLGGWIVRISEESRDSYLDQSAQLRVKAGPIEARRSTNAEYLVVELDVGFDASHYVLLNRVRETS